LRDTIAIEVKAKGTIVRKDEKALHASGEDLKLKRKIIVCNESHRRFSDSGVEIIPIHDFLSELWSGNLV